MIPYQCKTRDQRNQLISVIPLQLESELTSAKPFLSLTVSLEIGQLLDEEDILDDLKAIYKVNEMINIHTGVPSFIQKRGTLYYITFN